MRFDTTLKNIVSSSVEELLEAFGIKAKIKQEINIEFTSVRKKIVDTAFICEIDGQLYILHIEIQRGFSQDIVLRMVSYWVDIRMKHKIPVIQILIVFDFYEDVEGRFFEQTRYGGIDFRFQIINLSKAQNLKESRFAEIRILSVLNPDTDIGDIVDFLKQSNLPEEKFWELITKMYILSSVVGKEKEVERFMEDITIDLTKLRLFREAFEKTRKQAIEEGIEQGRKEGIEKGRKEGIEKGRKEGLREGLKEGFHKAIESLLVAKYGKRGRKLMSKIREIEKIDHLKKINIEIMKAKEFDNLVKKIDSITKNSK